MAASKAVLSALPILQMHPKNESCKSVELMSRFLNFCTIYRGFVKLLEET